jgi:uncharacterized protein YecT (DUF1311 family)
MIDDQGAPHRAAEIDLIAATRLHIGLLGCPELRKSGLLLGRPFVRQACEPVGSLNVCYGGVVGSADASGIAAGSIVAEAEGMAAPVLGALEMSQVPAASASDFNVADAELNAAYRRVMAAKDPVSGTVTRDGIRTAQRAWLSYRDASVAFAKIKYPSVTSESIRTRLTQKRVAELKAFLN